MFKSLFGIVEDVAKIAIAPVKIAADLPKVGKSIGHADLLGGNEFVPKTPLAKKLWAWRQAAIKAGEPMSPPLELLEQLRKSRE